MLMPLPSVVFVAPDKMGGVVSMLANLLAHRQDDGFEYRAVLTHNRFDDAARAKVAWNVDRLDGLEFASPIENMHAVVRRLHQLVGRGPGLLVCNDALELLGVSLLDHGRTVVQIVHGDYDYYYDLAAEHEQYVHAFVTVSRQVFQNLQARLPHRRDAIFWLPFGIPIAGRGRTPVTGPLRLLFSGRLDEAKGVFLLPEIDRLLRERNVAATWTVVGDGPARDQLRARWSHGGNVRWIGSATPDEAMALCPEHDAFVLPTAGEGLPVSLVEAMSAGVVPVVTDLPSLREIVDDEVTGLRVPNRDAAAFAAAIERLGANRAQLDSMSSAARALARDRFDIRTRVAGYQALFARWRELYRPWPGRATMHGSRLDQPWIPNAVVRMVRSAMRAR